MEVLLVVRGGEHEERPPENDPEALERVSTLFSWIEGSQHVYHSSGRMFFGRGAVMAKGLGNTVEEEHLPGLHLLSQVRIYLQSQLGCMLTVIGSVSRVKLASFSPIPLRTKSPLGSTTSTLQISLVPASGSRRPSPSPSALSCNTTQIPLKPCLTTKNLS